MTEASDWLVNARSKWQNRGQVRPSFAREPSDHQESVWDYPRPPALAKDTRHVTVSHGGKALANTVSAVRVLETASPPTFYLAPDDVTIKALIVAPGSSHCEWKGKAQYWALKPGQPPIGWSYPDPYKEFSSIAGWFSFYPARADCRVDGEVVQPQPGGFYGGWMTSEIVGPVKGDPGSQAW